MDLSLPSFKKLYTLTAFLVFSIGVRDSLYAQKDGQAYVDSLLPEMPKLKDDTTKVKVFAVLSYRLHFFNPDEGIKYGIEGVNLAKKLNWPVGVAGVLNSLGVNYQVKGNYNAALDCFLKALKINEQTGKKLGQARNLGNIAAIYSDQSDYPRAVDYNLRSMKVYEELGSKEGVMLCLGNIGNIYLYSGEYQKSLDYNFRSLKLAEEVNAREDMSIDHLCIGDAYKHLGMLTKALEHYNKALKISEETDQIGNIASTLGSIGTVFLMQKDYEQALVQFKKAYRLAKESGDKNTYAATLGNIGQVYLGMAEDGIKVQGSNAEASSVTNIQTNYFRKAIPFFLKAIEINTALGDLDHLKNDYHALADAYKGLGSYKAALTAHEQYVMLKDSVFNKENTAQIARLEVQSQYEKKQLADSLKQVAARKLTNEKIQRQRTYLWAGAAFAILLLGFSVTTFRKNKKLSLERLRNKISRDLHDEVGSTLSSVSLMNEVAIRSKDEQGIRLGIAENIQKAQDAMSEIVWMLNPKNDQLENFILRLGEVAKEMLELKGINYTMKVPENFNKLMISTEKRREIFLIFKECLNNITKYAECDEVLIELKASRKTITIRVTDNGKGFDSTILTCGNGLHNMKDRASGMKGSVSVNSSPGKGTKVELLVPLS
jgi:two-component system, NarL family, sensor histidine kinase UhpB